MLHKGMPRIITQKDVEHLESLFQRSLEKGGIFCINAKESVPIAFSHELITTSWESTITHTHTFQCQQQCCRIIYSLPLNSDSPGGVLKGEGDCEEDSLMGTNRLCDW